MITSQKGLKIMDEWYKTDICGQLFLDTIFVRSYTPILFTCRDTNNNQYLVMTLDCVDGKYIIAPVSDQSLLDLTSKNIAIDAFLKEQKLLYSSLLDDDFNLILERTDGSKLSADELPDPETYLEKF